MEFVDSDSSDDELNLMAEILIQAQANMDTLDEGKDQPKGGSRKGKKPNLERWAQEGAKRLELDYFIEDCTYDAKLFRRRFRMSRNLFLRIADAVAEVNSYFVQRVDATGKLGLTKLQKCTAAIRQLAYGSAADSLDEYLRMAESTALKCLLEYCQTVLDVFGSEYLRAPNNQDIARLLEEGKKRGFPGMLGSLDCCHWRWKNCPTAWAGQFQGKEKKPTIILEAVASYDLWIWHAYFGMPGSNNDVNVLERSPLFSDLYCGRAPTVEFTINGNTYTNGYYLADGIYPKFSTLVQTISAPIGRKRKHFAKMQEAARKDVERAFGVLTARFAILANPARLWSMHDLGTVMRACIVLHNMIIEDERDLSDPEEDFDVNSSFNVGSVHDGSFQQFLKEYEQVHSESLHKQLQNDLIEHLWQMKGDEE